ncbi:uncharacterized protein LOC135369740 [Ornithodoros turicata]|uniref:uncharacterized protein LOC135369740 n=1 Tax=Ornithodoros turicata TaxID=34597 RepID=UPI00313A37D5
MYGVFTSPTTTVKTSFTGVQRKTMQSSRILLALLVLRSVHSIQEFCQVDKRMEFAVATELGRVVNYLFKKCIPIIMENISFKPNADNITMLIRMTCESLQHCWQQFGDDIQKIFDCVYLPFPDKLRKLNFEEKDIDILGRATLCVKPKLKSVEVARYVLSYAHKISG